jgi:cytochrome P450
MSPHPEAPASSLPSTPRPAPAPSPPAVPRIVQEIPGLRFPLPVYMFRPWVKLGHPIRLFEYLLKTYGNIAHYRFMGTPIVFLNDPRYIQHLFDTDVTPDIRAINDEVNTIMHLYNFIVAFPSIESFLHLPIPGVVKFRKSKARLDAVVNHLIAEHRKSSVDKGDLLSMLLASTYEPVDAEALPSSTKAPSTEVKAFARSTVGLSVGLQPHESSSPQKGALAQGPSSAQPERMSDSQVRDEVLTIFLAGYETVANALTWTWYLLSQNPEAEKKLHAELDAVLGTGSQQRLPTLADYPRLRYTEQVFAESMRLYPPAWAMGRMSTREIHLGPYNIPAGAHVFFSQYIMSRTPEYFPDPLRFDPDRFTPEAKAARPKFTYFPFGGGSRQCIGESFAWMEGVFSIATIAQRWRMAYLGSTPPVPQAKITLRPRDPLMMQLSPR